MLNADIKMLLKDLAMASQSLSTCLSEVAGLVGKTRPLCGGAEALKGHEQPYAASLFNLSMILAVSGNLCVDHLIRFEGMLPEKKGGQR